MEHFGEDGHLLIVSGGWKVLHLEAAGDILKSRGKFS
jgi:hypothetical protein